MIKYTWIALASLLLACRTDTPAPPDQDLLADKYPALVEVAAGMAEACPPTDLDSTAARDACSANLRDYSELHNMSEDVVYWGGHRDSDHDTFDPDDHGLTEFDRSVWRIDYGGQFMFDGVFSIEERGDFVALQLSTQFRTGLPLGYLPYPFNHDASGTKWDAHQNATHIYLVFRQSDEQLVAAYRYGDDPSRFQVVLDAFDGLWLWFTSGVDGQIAEPRVSMYGYIFDAGNPHIGEVEGAWVELFDAYRDLECDSACHNPTNPSQMQHLRILSMPAQALVGAVGGPNGFTVVDELRDGRMPPGGMPAEDLDFILPLAIEYERVARLAIEWEDERHAEDGR